MLGSDGVWDNVFDEEINAVCESVVNTGLSGGALAAEIASSVAKYASSNAHDKSSVSPFYARYNRIRHASAAVPHTRIAVSNNSSDGFLQRPRHFGRQTG